jgi:hypothetical protein
MVKSSVACVPRIASERCGEKKRLDLLEQPLACQVPVVHIEPLAAMATQMATKDITSNSECFTKEVMPITVAIAPGPNMIGMANGTKAKSSSPVAVALATLPAEAPEAEGEKSSKPSRIRMIPPTIRTMLKGTPNIHMISLPKMRKKNARSMA